MITYIELLKWYNENKNILENFLIKNVYKIDKGVCFQIYSKNSEYKYLYIIPGKIIFLSNEKFDFDISPFILKLRKIVKNKRGRIEIDKEYKIVNLFLDDIIIYFELIPNGVIVITKDNKILFANEYKSYGYRKIEKGSDYLKPPKKDIIVKDFDKFKEIIEKSEKKGIVRKLAIDIGIGGKYSEYLLKISNIDKNKDSLSYEELDTLYKNYLKLLESNFILDDNLNYRYKINEYFIELFKKEFDPLKDLKEKKEKIINVINNLENEKNKIISKIEELNKKAEFLYTYSWIFSDYDINRIKKEFENIGIKLNIYSENNKIVIETED